MLRQSTEMKGDKIRILTSITHIGTVCFWAPGTTLDHQTEIAISNHNISCMPVGHGHGDGAAPASEHYFIAQSESQTADLEIPRHLHAALNFHSPVLHPVYRTVAGQ